MMKLAVIGSRRLTIPNLEENIPNGVTEIVSGGAKGVDACAAEYARSHGLKLTEFLPEYKRYGRGAPFKRNLRIIEYADEVLALWDGQSSGTKYVIEQCNKEKQKCNGYCVSMTVSEKSKPSHTVAIWKLMR